MRRDTYWFGKIGINVDVMEGEGKAGSETPSPVENVDRPEKLDGLCSFFWVGDYFKEGFSSVETEFNAHPSNLADDPPGQGLFVAVKMIDCLCSVSN